MILQRTCPKPRWNLFVFGESSPPPRFDHVVKTQQMLELLCVCDIFEAQEIVHKLRKLNPTIFYSN